MYGEEQKWRKHVPVLLPKRQENDWAGTPLLGRLPAKLGRLPPISKGDTSNVVGSVKFVRPKNVPLTLFIQANRCLALHRLEIYKASLSKLRCTSTVCASSTPVLLHKRRLVPALTLLVMRCEGVRGRED